MRHSHPSDCASQPLTHHQGEPRRTVPPTRRAGPSLAARPSISRRVPLFPRPAGCPVRVGLGGGRRVPFPVPARLSGAGSARGPRRASYYARTLLHLGLTFFCAVNLYGADMVASWYGAECAGKPMANGKPFRPEAMTCASWDFPLGTRLTVSARASSLSGQRPRSVIVEVTDRGPAKRLLRSRQIDLSRGAFSALAPLERGLVEVRVERIINEGHTGNCGKDNPRDGQHTAGK